MLVLEGADNSGKTTLAKTLVNQNPKLTYWHSGSAPRDPVHEDICLFEQFKEAIQPLTIVDRVTCISQQVYQDGRLGEDKLIKELDKLIAHGVIIVYCKPSLDKLMSFQNFTWRDEETEAHKIKVIENQHTYVQRYEEVMRHIPHIIYDFEDPASSTWLVNQLVDIDKPYHYSKLMDLVRARKYA